MVDSHRKLQVKAAAIYGVAASAAIPLLQELVIGPMMATDEEAPHSRFRADLEGGGQAAAASLSPETLSPIDEETRLLLDEAHGNALEILTENETALREIARVLQEEEEVIDGETMARLAAGVPTGSSAS